MEIILVPPRSVIANADLRGEEYAWKPKDFPIALEEAARLGYRCVGGQFQFRLPDNSTCEMYWLDSDAPDREIGEEWQSYVTRCERAVRIGFYALMDATDFLREAQSWEVIREKMATDSFDPLQHLVFVAYFENEQGQSF